MLLVTVTNFSLDPNIKCDTSYEIIKSVREYKGEEDKYVSW